MQQDYVDKLPPECLKDAMDKVKQIPPLFHPDITLGEMKDLYRFWFDNYVEFYTDLGKQYVLHKDFNPEYLFRIVPAMLKKVGEDVKADLGDSDM